MAKLAVSEELVIQQLFPSLTLSIVGVDVDQENRTLIFEVEGKSVPDAEFVTGTFTMTLGEPEPKRIIKGELRAA